MSLNNDNVNKDAKDIIWRYLLESSSFKVGVEEEEEDSCNASGNSPGIKNKTDVMQHFTKLKKCSSTFPSAQYFVMLT